MSDTSRDPQPTLDEEKPVSEPVIDYDFLDELQGARFSGNTATAKTSHDVP